jgi:hypothetical protein
MSSSSSSFSISTDNNKDGTLYPAIIQFSPYIIPIFFTFLGFYSGLLKGVIYIVSLLFSFVLRQIIYDLMDLSEDNLNFYSKDRICREATLVSDVFDLPPFVSLWIFFHTLGYIIWPIFISISTALKNNKKGIATGNIFFLIIFLFYLVANFHFQYSKGCIRNRSDANTEDWSSSQNHIILNTCVSFFVSSVFVLSMMSGSQTAKELIYFNDVYNTAKTSKTGCNRVTPTKFRCSA